MAKLHIKKGDMVYVNAGNDKGKTGKVLAVNTEKNRAIVEGVNMVSKHTKPNSKNPQGGIVKQRGPSGPSGRHAGGVHLHETSSPWTAILCLGMA